MVLSGKVCQSLLLAQAAGCDDATSFQRLTDVTNSKLVVDPLHEQTQVGKGLIGHTEPAPVASAYPGVACQDDCSAAALIQPLLRRQTVRCSRRNVVRCMLPHCTQPAAAA